MGSTAIPLRLLQCARAHFELGVPINQLGLRGRGGKNGVQADRLARVDHVYWQWRKNPMIDPEELFRALLRSQGTPEQYLSHIVARDVMLFRYVIENITGSTRKESEYRVRYAANRLIRIGSETDNARALTSGSRLLIELDHLDQPEDQQADMSKAAFLPALFTSNIQDVDDTKENIDDEKVREIMQRYGGYVDEKRQLIADKVRAMELKDIADGAEGGCQVVKHVYGMRNDE